MTGMKPLFTGGVVAAALAIGTATTAEQAMPERSGPWAFTRQAGARGVRYLATTPAIEDANVWLLLVCEQRRLTAALMDSAEFPYAIMRPPQLILRFANAPAVTVAAQPVGDNQFAIDERATRQVMRLIVDSERVVVSLDDHQGIGHEYTFSLQPNGVALAEILRQCWDEQE